MNDYCYSFTTKKTAKDLFELLLNIEQWWSGIFEETIEGKSEKTGDEFSFSAGGGMHFSKQKLAELIPYTKIVWEVTESNLSYLHDPEEWRMTQLIFEIAETNNETRLSFTHKGLEPQIECYNGCSTAWTQYLHNLENKLKAE